MEPLVAQLERIAEALEKIEKSGLMIVLDPDNIRETLEEVKSSTPRP